jgi:hypothetical protein
MESSAKDITAPATWFYCDGERVGSLPFYLPSPYKGMTVTFRKGSGTHTYVIESWRFLFSNHLNEEGGLLVEVREG